MLPAGVEKCADLLKRRARGEALNYRVRPSHRRCHNHPCPGRYNPDKSDIGSLCRTMNSRRSLAQLRIASGFQRRRIRCTRCDRCRYSSSRFSSYTSANGTECVSVFRIATIESAARTIRLSKKRNFPFAIKMPAAPEDSGWAGSSSATALAISFIQKSQFNNWLPRRRVPTEKWNTSRRLIRTVGIEPSVYHRILLWTGLYQGLRRHCAARGNYRFTSK